MKAEVSHRLSGHPARPQRQQLMGLASGARGGAGQPCHCEMGTVLPWVTSQPKGPSCRGLSTEWRLLTFSLSECSSSSLISFSLASRMACFVTERMASWVDTEVRTLGSRDGPSHRSHCSASTHPAAVAEALDLLHAELVGKQGGGLILCGEAAVSGPGCRRAASRTPPSPG